jgi:predicted ATP-grasp superfamily ATP-dependent carboligase
MTDRLPATIASAVGAREEISLRLALPDDDVAIHRLSELASRQLSGRVVLVAEADGEILAAASADGCVIGDPFRVTLDVAELLRLRAAQLRAAARAVAAA